MELIKAQIVALPFLRLQRGTPSLELASKNQDQTPTEQVLSLQKFLKRKMIHIFGMCLFSD